MPEAAVRGRRTASRPRIPPRGLRRAYRFLRLTASPRQACAHQGTKREGERPPVTKDDKSPRAPGPHTDTPNDAAKSHISRTKDAQHLVVDEDADEPVTAPVITFTRSVRGAATATGSHSYRADVTTFERVRDLVTALVKVYQEDKATPKREARYNKFLNAQRAEKIQPQIDALTAKINTLDIQRAELLEKLAAYTA